MSRCDDCPWRLSNGNCCSLWPEPPHSWGDRDAAALSGSITVPPGGYTVNCSERDPINPPHYRDLKPEPIDVIEGWGLDYHRASAIKYLARAGRKGDEIEDLEKCAWFIQRKIELLKGGKR